MKISEKIISPILNINSHAGGWSLWRTYTVKSIFLETVSLKWLQLFSLSSWILFLHLLFKSKLFKKISLAFKTIFLEDRFFIVKFIRWETFTKSLETTQFWIIEVVSFKIPNPDSVRVKIRKDSWSCWCHSLNGFSQKISR